MHGFPIGEFSLSPMAWLCSGGTLAVLVVQVRRVWLLQKHIRADIGSSGGSWDVLLFFLSQIHCKGDLGDPNQPRSRRIIFVLACEVVMKRRAGRFRFGAQPRMQQ